MWVDEVTQLVVTAGGMAVVLRWAGLIRFKRERPVEPVGPLCACTHVISAHGDGDGPCTADLKREHYQSGGDRNGWEYVPCPCKRYTGPKPIDSFFAPPQPYIRPEERP